MEVLLVIAIILFALGFVFEKASGFFKQLKSGSAKLFNGFEANLSVVPIDKKSEECAANTNSTNENLD